MASAEPTRLTPIIPKELNFIWLGTAPLRTTYIINILLAQKANPGHAINLWINPEYFETTTPEAPAGAEPWHHWQEFLKSYGIHLKNYRTDLDQHTEYQDLLKIADDWHLRKPVVSSDILRLMILYQKGGVYSDTDTLIRADLKRLDTEPTHGGRGIVTKLDRLHESQGIYFFDADKKTLIFKPEFKKNETVEIVEIADAEKFIVELTKIMGKDDNRERDLTWAELHQLITLNGGSPIKDGVILENISCNNFIACDRDNAFIKEMLSKMRTSLAEALKTEPDASKWKKQTVIDYSGPGVLCLTYSWDRCWAIAEFGLTRDEVRHNFDTTWASPGSTEAKYLTERDEQSKTAEEEILRGLVETGHLEAGIISREPLRYCYGKIATSEPSADAISTGADTTATAFLARGDRSDDIESICACTIS